MADARRSRRVATVTTWLIATALGLAPTVAAVGEEIGMATTIISAPPVADPGDLAEYTVSYSNKEASEPADARVCLILPAGAFLDWTAQDIDDVANSLTDTAGNVADIRIDGDSCDNILIHLAAPGGGAPAVPAGATNQFSVQIPLPNELPTIGTLRVNSPPSVAGLYEFTFGLCDDCGDPPSCFGGPLSQMPAVTADLELVNDPNPEAGQTPSMGCHALVGFTADNIAVVRRGGCGFGVKALNAENAGAAGVVIVNNEPNQNQNIHSFSMNGGSEGAQVTVPVVLIAHSEGEALISEMTAKTLVEATLGAVETEDLLFVSTAFHASGSPDTDPLGIDDSDGFVTVVDFLTNDPPEAGFLFSPQAPVKGQLIQFTDASTNDPTSWSWDFGDGIGTSDEQNPSYSYAEPGSYTVTLTATNEFGSDDFSDDVDVGILIPDANDYFIPAAAFAEGAEGSFFVTDVEINNAGPTPMTFQFVWLPRGQDNSVPTISRAYRLAPDSSARYVNVLSEIFDLEEAVGALGLVATTPDALILARIYNRPEGEEKGTFGQSLPGIPAEQLTRFGVRQRIMFMTENEEFRSNLGCINTTPANLRIQAELFTADATSLGVRNIDLRPWSNDQKGLPQLFEQDDPLEAGFVDVWTVVPDGSFYCYGSVADNLSNDPTTILPQ